MRIDYYVPREEMQAWLFSHEPPYLIKEVGPFVVFSTPDGPVMASAGFGIIMKESR